MVSVLILLSGLMPKERYTSLNITLRQIKVSKTLLKMRQTNKIKILPKLTFLPVLSRETILLGLGSCS
jgi:hypothetical protein